MKINQMIHELIKLRNEYGDLEIIHLTDNRYFDDFFFKIINDKSEEWVSEKGIEQPFILLV